MNAELLHDALTLLPADLITAADKARSHPRKREIRWTRWASIAACAALILFGGLLFRSGLFSRKAASTECAAEAPAEMQNFNAMESGAQDSVEHIEAEATPTAANSDSKTTGYPVSGNYFADLSDIQYCLTNQIDSTLCIDSSLTAVIQSREALENYYQDLSGFLELGSFYEACAVYDDAWFTEHDLLLVRMVTEKSEYRPEVQSLTLTGEATREIVISLTQQPEDNAPDPTCWHILIPVQKDLIANTDTITVILE